jgi:hypothetical protein
LRLGTFLNGHADAGQDRELLDVNRITAIFRVHLQVNNT